ncbi:MAG: hypothetical protein KGZ70_12915 [Hydrogenophaga sp.]|nr:hypothetical protein [Hydrogenophaga sp.]
MENKKHEMELLVHMFFGTLIFSVLAMPAVGLDLAAQWATSIGVSKFTAAALSGSSDILLAMDLTLFAAYISKTSWLFVKEMFK